MTVAKPSDWRTEPLPDRRATITLDRVYSIPEMERIRRGLLPEVMEDKWFIYWEDETLFFHRSWTGFCIYAVRFAAAGETFRMIEAQVNRDPDQYGETREARDAEMIAYLVDVLLLQKEAAFPSDEPSPETRALENWSQVGRAMLGQGPAED